jgi:hypothetical protein
MGAAMTDRELMQQARNALMYLWDGCPTDKDLIERLDDNLAQPEPEPVAWTHKYGCRANAFGECSMGCAAPLQREWQGLTDEEIAACIQMGESGSLDSFIKPLATYRAIEAKLKEKNT